MKSLKQIKGAQILSTENLKSITGGALISHSCNNGYSVDEEASTSCYTVCVCHGYIEDDDGPCVFDWHE